MAMVGVDDSSLQVDSWPELIGLVRVNQSINSHSTGFEYIHVCLNTFRCICTRPGVSGLVQVCLFIRLLKSSIETSIRLEL